MAALPKNVVHETPDEFLLSSVIKDIDCPKGCQRTFATTSALQMHLTKVHNDGSLTEKKLPDGTELWYHCPIERCIYNSSLEDKGKHFTKLKYVKQHYQKVHAERSFACECSSGFSTASLLAQHQRLCGIQMMCNCNRTFGSLESLQTHVRRENHTIHTSTTQEIQTRKMMQPTKTKSCINKESGASVNCTQRRGFVPILHASPGIYPGHNCSTPIQITSSYGLNSLASVHLPPTSIAQISTLNHSAGKIQQPIHLLAAVALSELSAHTGIKRAHCAEVAIQTDISKLKFVDKSSSPECGLEIGVEASCESNKQLKRSAETQTRLTLRDCKKIRCESPSVASSTTVSSRKLISNSSEKALQECELVVNNYLGTSLEDSVESEESSLESLTLQVDLPEFLTSQQSSSGTQTSPRAPGSLNRKYISNKSQMKYAMNDFTFSVLENVREDQASMTTAATTTMSATQTPNYLDPFAPGLFDDDDEEELMAAVVGPSSSGSKRLPSFGQNPSSSIETQTDHDVLLSSKAGMLDENDIILTSTETQTDPSTLLNPSKSDNPCQGPVCTGETQTCEDFSEIEQFLYSTIHTQTTDSSHSELFPELSFNDSHTQTGLDDTPGLVTTHTQTPHRGLTNCTQNPYSRTLGYPQTSTNMEYPTL